MYAATHHNLSIRHEDDRLAINRFSFQMSWVNTNTEGEGNDYSKSRSRRPLAVIGTLG